ncbi:MAG: adenylate cyclase [Actinomycetota bacterium]|nr:adenylate cyclase [Actinomycetota bacterium]
MTHPAPGGAAATWGSPELVAGAVALALPLAGLGLLLARPALDGHWEHHPAHFWLVLSVGALSAVLAYGTGVAAVRRGDARVLLVSLAFLASAGFLGLHALATPGVLLAGQNTGFTLATPVGLMIGSVFAAASCLDLSGSRGPQTMRLSGPLRLGLLVVMACWAVASLAQVPPLDSRPTPERPSGPLVALALAAILLYVFAALRFLALWRRRRASMLLGMAAAYMLLAEAIVAVVSSRNWHVTWWEWHVLMLVAFGLVAWSAHRQWHEERFGGLYLEDTVAGTRDMSILFADLQGFTSFSECHAPQDVTAMLNSYFEVAIPPIVRRYGGDIDRIIGDAVMVTFNRRGDQPDHAHRAAGAALALQEETAQVAAVHPDWPRFRVGVNSGAVSLSLLGAEGGRTHTVIGDTVNVASRLEGKAPVGGVAISADTAARIPEARTEPLGPLELKGKSEALEGHLLISLGTASGDRSSRSRRHRAPGG